MSAHPPHPDSRPVPRRDADTADLLKLLALFWRERWWLGAISASLMAAGAIWALVLATPMYRATSVVMLESRESAMLGLSSVLSSLSSADASVVNTEVEVLLGRSLLARVVDELDLTQDPEFNPSLREKGLLGRALQAWLGAPPPRSADAQISATVTTLLEHLAVQNVPQSLVFHITATSRSPERATDIADTLARLYIDDQLRVRFEATERATKWLSDQVSQLRITFENADHAVRDFRSQTTLISPENLEAMDRQIKETRRRREQLTQSLTALEQRLTALDAATSQAQIAEVLADETLQRLARDAAPPAALEFSARQAQLTARLREDRDRTAAQIHGLQSAEAALSADIAAQSQDLTNLEQLAREAEASRLLYEHFQTRLKETAAQQGINQADSRILSQAVLPDTPSEPRVALTVITMGLLGVLIGAALILLREMSQRRFRRASELEELTSRVVLAQIPQIPAKTRRAVVSYLREKPTSAAAEAVRNLRTVLLLAATGAAPKVIAITSSVPGEGKTTTAVALAQNITAMGRRVLLIEGDLRRCTLEAYSHLSRENRPSLTAVLEGRTALHDAIVQEPDVADILYGATEGTNATDLLATPAFATLIATARSLYDFVVIDTPPVLVVPDAKVILQHTDTALFVVHWDKTTQVQVTEALHHLDLVHANIAGLVLSHVDPAGMRRYGYDEAYGAYAAYGKTYYNA